MSEQADLKFTSLLGTVSAEMKSMLRLDAKLLQAELSAKASTAFAGGIWGAATLALSSFAVLMAFEGLIFVLIWLGLTAYIACFLVAALLGISALICGLKARASFLSLSLVPTTTIAAIQKDVATLKGALLNVDP